MTSSEPVRMPRFAVRVCGVEVVNVTVRLVVGSSGARHEIVFEDPILGVLPLDDTLTIEIWRLKGPLSPKVASRGRPWTLRRADIKRRD